MYVGSPSAEYLFSAFFVAGGWQWFFKIFFIFYKLHYNEIVYCIFLKLCIKKNKLALPLMQTASQNLSIQKKIAALSIVLFIIKMLAYILTHSVAILTDALESIVNIVEGILGI